MFATLFTLSDIEWLTLLDLFEGIKVFLFDMVALNTSQMLGGAEGVYLLGSEIRKVSQFINFVI